MNSRDNPKRRRIESPSHDSAAHSPSVILPLTSFDSTANSSDCLAEFSAQHNLYHDSIVCCVRFSRDGQYLASGSEGAAQIYDAQSGQKLATLSKDTTSLGNSYNGSVGYVRAVCFSPDSNLLITGTENHVVKIWDVRSRNIRQRLLGHTARIYSVEASENGSFITSGSGDGKAKLWSLHTGMLLRSLDSGHNGGITSVAVSPTSQQVSTTSLDGIIRLWDLESARIVRRYEGHKDAVHSVTFSPDGRYLLSGSFDATLKLWDLSESHPSSACRVSFTGHKDFVLSVAFSPNGRLVFSGSKDRSVRIWDPRKPSLPSALQGHTNSVISIEHNPVCERFATGPGTFLHVLGRTAYNSRFCECIDVVKRRVVKTEIIKLIMQMEWTYSTAWYSMYYVISIS